MEQKSDRPLSLRQTAARYGIGRALLARAIREGELRAYQPGERSVLVFPSDFESWLARVRVQPRRDAEECRK